MSWARVQSIDTDAAGAGTVTVTLTSTPTTGNIIVAHGVVNGTAATSFTSIQDGNSVSLTQIAVNNGTGLGNFAGAAIYAYVVPASPSKAFTMTFGPSSSNGYNLLVIEFSGTTATADGTFGTISSTTSPVSATYSSTALNELLITSYGDQGTPYTTAPSGYTLDPNSDNAGAQNAPNTVGYKNSTNGSEGNSWTFSNDQAVIITGAFQLPGGGAAFYPFKRYNTVPIRRAANW